MKIAGREVVYYSHSKDNKPAITVLQGEIFKVRTELCSGSWLKEIGDLWSPEKSKGPNPTVCVAVNGAMPGDTLKVEILSVEPEELGYTVIKDEKLNEAIMKRQLEPNPRTVRIKDGEIYWNDKLRIKTKPMVGTMGTSSVEGLSNSWGGYYGGNMDVNEITGGTTVYFPVTYEGALLNVGDAHAIQGDGEICNAGGIECRALVTLRCEVLKKHPKLECVTAENDQYLMTIACLKTTDESFYTACRNLIGFVCSRYEIKEEECFSLASQVMEARCTQFVNPTRSYICKMPKDVLDRGYIRK